MPEILRFPDYAPDRWARLQAHLNSLGLEVSGNSGRVRDLGADVAYEYAGGALTLTVNKAPFLHTMGGFCRRLQATVEGQL